MTELELKLTTLLKSMGFSDDQLEEIQDFSLSQIERLGSDLNVFETIHIEVIDDINESFIPQVAVMYSLKCNTPDGKLIRYPDENSTEIPKYVSINEINVSSEYDKEQLLLAFKYIHDIQTLDTDILAVNTIAHLYQRPDLIVIK